MSMQVGPKHTSEHVDSTNGVGQVQPAASECGHEIPTAGMGPVSQGVPQRNIAHGGTGHVGALAALKGTPEACIAQADIQPPALESPAMVRARLMKDPGVQAALARVPGMKALKLEMLTPRSIALGALSGTETAQLIKDKKVSVTEVVQASIDRAKAGEHLGPIDHKLFDRAIAQAKEMDRKGDFSAPFAGVPIAIKANAKLKGAPTSYGSRAIPESPAKENAPHVQDYLDLGVIPIFLSQTSEFGFNGVTEPEGGQPARNPHNPEHTAGGSSGGSAVAVSAGIVSFAHGTDGGGSCRIPAALCGILGIKPSKGRQTLLDRAEELPVLINMPGLLARSAADLSLAMQHLDRGEAKGMRPLGLVDTPPMKSLNVAYYIDPVGGEAEDSSRRATLEMVDRLRQMGHTVEEIAPPYTQRFVNDFLGIYRLIAWKTSDNLEKNEKTDHTKLETFSKGLGDLNMIQRAWAFVVSKRRLKGSHTERYNKVFEKHDLLLNPTVTGDAPKIGALSPAQTYGEMRDDLLDLVGYTPLQNATGTPSMSIPVGMSENGLPRAVQFSAKMGNDGLLLQMGHQLSKEEAPDPAIMAHL